MDFCIIAFYLKNLKKQSRQAKRYKNIQNDISRARATVFYQKWKTEKEKLEELKKKYTQQEDLVSNQTHTVASNNVEYENIQQQLTEVECNSYTPDLFPY